MSEILTLTKQELAERLIRGQKLVSIGNSDTKYCYFDDSQIVPFRRVSKCGNEAMHDSWNCTQWKLYEEPKPKKTIEIIEVLIGDFTGAYFIGQFTKEYADKHRIKDYTILSTRTIEVEQ